jgi:hypothetical protein
MIQVRYSMEGPDLAHGLPPNRLITSSRVRPCCMHHVSSRLISTGSGRSRDASPASSLYPRRFSSSTTYCLLTDCAMTITKPLCQQATRQICARVCPRDLTGGGETGRRLRMCLPPRDPRQACRSDPPQVRRAKRRASAADRRRRFPASTGITPSCNPTRRTECRGSPEYRASSRAGSTPPRRRAPAAPATNVP